MPDDITQQIALTERTYTRQIVNAEKIVGVMPIRYHATTAAEWHGVRLMFEDSSEFLVAGSVDEWAETLQAEGSPDRMQIGGERTLRSVRIRDVE